MINSVWVTGDAEVVDGDEGSEGKISSLEGGGSSFEAVADADDADDFAAEFLDAVDGLESGSAGGDDVFDDEDFIAGFDGAFDEFLGAVVFGFLADDEADEVGLRLGSEGDHAGDDRVCSDGQSADGVVFEVADRFEHGSRDEVEAAGVQGDLFAVEEKVRLLAGSEGEVATQEGSFEIEIDQRLFPGGSGHVGVLSV